MKDIETRLIMNFSTELGRRVSIYLDDPKDNLLESEVVDVMNYIISKNIFKTYNTSLTTAIDAKVITTDTTDYDLVV